MLDAVFEHVALVFVDHSEPAALQGRRPNRFAGDLLQGFKSGCAAGEMRCRRLTAVHFVDLIAWHGCPSSQPNFERSPRFLERNSFDELAGIMGPGARYDHWWVA